jgi:2Fe-2S ferredoxin
VIIKLSQRRFFLKVIVINREGAEREVQADAGLSLMEVIRDNDFGELSALCGGCCSCATCHVYVDTAFISKLPSLSYDENDLLNSSSFRQEGSRLSCQVPLTPDMDGVRVTIAPED